MLLACGENWSLTLPLERNTFCACGQGDGARQDAELGASAPVPVPQPHIAADISDPRLLVLRELLGQEGTGLSCVAQAALLISVSFGALVVLSRGVCAMAAVPEGAAVPVTREICPQPPVVAQLGGHGVPTPMGDPGVRNSFYRFVVVHPGLGLGADVDELKQDPLPSVSVHVTPVLTSAHICQAWECCGGRF